MSSQNEPSRDVSFKLSSADRATVGSQFDPGALEEFLQMHNPVQRASLLASFQRSVTRKPDGDLADVSVLTHVSDPRIQEVLERVWAPAWAHWSLERLEHADPNLTGVRAARQLKRATRERIE